MNHISLLIIFFLYNNLSILHSSNEKNFDELNKKIDQLKIEFQNKSEVQNHSHEKNLHELNKQIYKLTTETNNNRYYLKNMENNIQKTNQTFNFLEEKLLKRNNFLEEELLAHNNFFNYTTIITAVLGATYSHYGSKIGEHIWHNYITNPLFYPSLIRKYLFNSYFNKKNYHTILFNDIGGYNNIKAQLSEIIENTKNNTKKTNMTGIILWGPPGTGKTYFAQAIANENNLSFAVISSTDINSSSYMGESERQLKYILKEAQIHAPSIIFIDEIENLISDRNQEKSNLKSALNSIKNILLSYMDGTENMGQTIIIGATNNIENIDKAFLRPGRFEHIIKIDLPSYQDRLEIIKIIIKKNNLLLSSDITLNYLAERTANFTAADLNKLFSIVENLNKKNGSSWISIDTFIQAYLECTLGSKNTQIILNNNEKTNTAVHESGHALLQYILSQSENQNIIFDFVTISPHGNTLGTSHSKTLMEYTSLTKEHAKNQISILLAGRIAQEIILNQIDAGALNDLEEATLIAQNMIIKLGFGKKISQIQNKNEVIEETNEIIDTEYKKVTDFFKQHKSLLLIISNELIKKEILYKKDIEKIVNKYEINNNIKLTY